MRIQGYYMLMPNDFTSRICTQSNNASPSCSSYVTSSGKSRHLRTRINVTGFAKRDLVCTIMNI